MQVHDLDYTGLVQQLIPTHTILGVFYTRNLPCMKLYISHVM